MLQLITILSVLLSLTTTFLSFSNTLACMSLRSLIKVKPQLLLPPHFRSPLFLDLLFFSFSHFLLCPGVRCQYGGKARPVTFFLACFSYLWISSSQRFLIIEHLLLFFYFPCSLLPPRVSVVSMEVKPHLSPPPGLCLFIIIIFLIIYQFQAFQCGWRVTL